MHCFEEDSQHEYTQAFCFRKKVKVCFYVAQHPVRWTAQNALHFTPWQTCSFRHQLGFSVKHSATLLFRAKTIHSHFHYRPKPMPKLRNGSKENSNPGSLNCELGNLPLSYSAPRKPKGPVGPVLEPGLRILLRNEKCR